MQIKMLREGDGKNWLCKFPFNDFRHVVPIDELEFQLFFLVYFQSRRKNPKKRGAKDENLDNLKQELDIDTHKVSLEELYRRFQTNLETVSISLKFYFSRRAEQIRVARSCITQRRLSHLLSNITHLAWKKCLFRATRYCKLRCCYQKANM
jgi:hypothetical protein